MAAGWDAVVIGAGHNGLVAGAALAKAGRKVLILEAAERPGGAAVTEELIPGFKVPTCAHVLHLLHPRVMKDLDLAGNGLELAQRNMATIALGPEGRYVTLLGDQASGAISADDAAAYGKLRRRLLKMAAQLQPSLAEVPPRLAGRARDDLLGLLKLGWRLRRLGRADMREFLRIAFMNVHDLLQENFESDLVKAAVAVDAVLGSNLGPRSPGSVLSLIYRLAGKSGGVQGALAVPRGGMGAVTDAMVAAAHGAGAVLRCAAQVRRIVVEGDRAVGVELADGEQIDAATVLSSADPKRSFLELTGVEHLDAGFVRRIRNFRCHGLAAKLHLALDDLPRFTGLTPAELQARILLAPDLDYVERAFNPSKYRKFSPDPIFEITLPSVADPGLAPEGKHVLSAVVQYAPYDLEGGWEAGREAFLERLLTLLEAYAPGLRALVLHAELLSPVDIEARFGITGGHWHHGELSVDQLFMLRPVPGAAQYVTPLPGFYLCGAGSHPGGGVMGAAGMNAAARVLAKEFQP